MINDIGAWVARKLIWFLLILIGFIAYWNLHPVWEDLERQVAEATTASTEAPKAKSELEDIKATSIKIVEDAKFLSKNELDQRIYTEELRIQALQKALEEAQGIGISKAIKRELIEGKLALSDWVKRECTAARSNLLNDVEKRHLVPIKEAELRQRESEYARKKAAYDQIPIGFGENSTVNSIASSGISMLNKLTATTDWEIKDPGSAYRELESLNKDITARRNELEAWRHPTASQASPIPSTGLWLNKIASLEQSATARLKSSWVHAHIIQPASAYWPAALLTLILAIVFSPLARVICYYVLAPLASRQSPIILGKAKGTGNDISTLSNCRTSFTLHLHKSDALLIHHDYAKTIPSLCRSTTQTILDKHSPITSFFSGLYNLLRIEPKEDVSLEISSGHDGLNELIYISLEKDAEIVIEPRSIVGATLKEGQEVILRKIWAIGKLQSWLKGQFRHIAIRGPLRIIVKGGRGVTVSPVEDELRIPSEYVIGFSTNLGYATERTETFGGYYSRKKPLLNDRFTGSNGVVIHQEANYKASSSHVKKGGLEGLMDGVLKAFGI